MADETNAATNQNSGTETAKGTLLTEGSNADAGAKDQQTDTTQANAGAQTQTEKDAAAAAEAKAKEEAAAAAAKTGAPEKYEFKMPEGIKLDEAQLKAFEPWARKNNLTQESAQELVDLQADLVKRQAQAQVETWTNQTKAWKDEITNDPALGGKNLDGTINAAKSVLKQFADEGTLKFLEDYGMGNHPGLVRMLAKIGKAMSEDTFKNGNATTTDSDDIAAKEQRMFPNSLKKK